MTKGFQYRYLQAYLYHHRLIWRHVLQDKLIVCQLAGMAPGNASWHGTVMPVTHQRILIWDLSCSCPLHLLALQGAAVWPILPILWWQLTLMVWYCIRALRGGTEKQVQRINGTIQVVLS